MNNAFITRELCEQDLQFESNKSNNNNYENKRNKRNKRTKEVL